MPAVLVDTGPLVALLIYGKDYGQLIDITICLHPVD
jgi:hypothetical protein